MNQQFFEAVSSKEEIEANRPSVGKTVKVVSGRKHLGAVGVVVWHGIDKYAPPLADSYEQAFLAERVGRLGYRIKVQSETGEAFFVSADYAEVIA